MRVATTRCFDCHSQSQFLFRRRARQDRGHQTTSRGEAMNANENRHAVLAPGEGEVLEAGGNRLLIKVASPSQFLCEYTAPPYFAGPPLHVHPGFDETLPRSRGTTRGDGQRRTRRAGPWSGRICQRGCPPHVQEPRWRPSALPARLLTGWFRGLLPRHRQHRRRGHRRGCGASGLQGRRARRLTGTRRAHREGQGSNHDRSGLTGSSMPRGRAERWSSPRTGEAGRSSQATWRCWQPSSYVPTEPSSESISTRT